MKKRKREPQYNWVYKKLTEDGQDESVINFLAYAFYKKEKIQEIEAYQKAHGCYPDDDDLATFRERSQSDAKLEEYRRKAESMLQNYSDSVDEAIVRDSVSEELSKLDIPSIVKTEIKKAEPEWWRTSLCQLRDTILVAFALYWICKLLNSGFLTTIKELFGFGESL